MTRVDLAEGKLLNEIHERISLGITMALSDLISTSREDGAEQVLQKMRDESELIVRGHALDDADVEMRYGERDFVVALHDLYVVPASILAPPADNALPVVYGDLFPIRGTP